MQFDRGYIYHIYNQGNNKQKIFFTRENYFFFLEKIRKHILPYADIFAWCLMPNHFHLMVLVNELEMAIGSSQGVTPKENVNTPYKNGGSLKKSHPLTKKQVLNDSIGIMLRSYTRAINNQESFNGSLFRNDTKAQCVNCPKGISPNWFVIDGITTINIKQPEKQYPQICFDYIHQNPVKAGLVRKIDDWEFSSAADYAGKRNGKLINKEKAREYVVF